MPESLYHQPKNVCPLCNWRAVPDSRSVCERCVPSKAMPSQCAAVGAPPPKTWDDYERACHDTFGGGYRTEEERDVFRHGMTTVFDLLRGEFKTAEECRR